ncbi:hypothetical protein ACFE04_027675 [Oxalis oulophora]
MMRMMRSVVLFLLWLSVSAAVMAMNVDNGVLGNNQVNNRKLLHNNEVIRTKVDDGFFGNNQVHNRKPLHDSKVIRTKVDDGFLGNNQVHNLKPLDYSKGHNSSNIATFVPGVGFNVVFLTVNAMNNGVMVIKNGRTVNQNPQILLLGNYVVWFSCGLAMGPKSVQKNPMLLVNAFGIIFQTTHVGYMAGDTLRNGVVYASGLYLLLITLTCLLANVAKEVLGMMGLLYSGSVFAYRMYLGFTTSPLPPLTILESTLFCASTGSALLSAGFFMSYGVITHKPTLWISQSFVFVQSIILLLIFLHKMVESLTTPPLTMAVVPSPPPFAPSSVLISVASLLLPEAEQGLLEFRVYEVAPWGNYVLCSKCFKNENHGENRSMEDFIFKGYPGSKNVEGPVSAEAETLLFLESDFLMRSANEGGDFSSLSLIVNDSLKPVNLASSGNLETQKTENQSRDQSNQSELYRKVARISTMVGPEVAAAAVEAAITVLCDESSCPREIFDVDDHLLTIGTQPCELERELDQDDVEMKERLHQSDLYSRYDAAMIVRHGVLLPPMHSSQSLRYADILCLSEEDLRNPPWAPPGGYGISPGWLILKKNYDDTQGHAPPIFYQKIMIL